MKPRCSTLSLVTVLAFALGAAAFGCGPQKKFCPKNPPGRPDDGVCIVPVDAAVEAMTDGPAEERGSIFIGDDASGN